MGVIKINNIIYGSNNSADIIYKNTTVEEKIVYQYLTLVIMQILKQVMIFLHMHI